MDATKRCRCGFSEDNIMVSAKPLYSIARWIMLGTGMTPAPKRIVYRCRRCDHVFREVTDPAALRAFRY